MDAFKVFCRTKSPADFDGAGLANGSRVCMSGRTVGRGLSIGIDGGSGEVPRFSLFKAVKLTYSGRGGLV